MGHMNLNKPAGEANMYVQFRYVPRAIWNHTQGKISELLNADTINTKKNVEKINAKIKTETPKDKNLNTIYEKN